MAVVADLIRKFSQVGKTIVKRSLAGQTSGLNNTFNLVDVGSVLEKESF